MSMEIWDESWTAEMRAISFDASIRKKLTNLEHHSVQFKSTQRVGRASSCILIELVCRESPMAEALSLKSGALPAGAIDSNSCSIMAASRVH